MLKNSPFLITLGRKFSFTEEERSICADMTAIEFYEKSKLISLFSRLSF